MTPPPTGSHTASRAISLGPQSTPARLHARATESLLDRRNWPKVRLLVDLIVLYLASSAALFAAPMHELFASRLLAGLFPLLVLVIMHARRGPDEHMQASRLDTAAHVLGVVSLAAMLTIGLDAILRGIHPVEFALRLWLFGFVYLAGARCVLVTLRRQAARFPEFATPTLILGAGAVGEIIFNRLIREPSYGLRPVGFLDSTPQPRAKTATGATPPILGGLDDLERAVETTGARHVILSFSSEPDRVLVDKVRRCQELGLEVSVVPRLYEVINDRAILDHVGGLPLVGLRSVDPRGWQFALKHAFDRGFATIALIACGPLMLAIALAVRLSSPGPVLFRQRRVGRDGREFDLLKFRTMHERAPDQRFELADGCAPGGVEGDDRRTSIGGLLRNWSLDELPQFMNVLRGEMSIVGPRPERPEFVQRFAAEIARYDDRHRVKSGITGWAQVHGLRGQTSIADRVEWDNYYIRNWSLRLDLQIIARTLGPMFRSGG